MPTSFTVKLAGGRGTVTARLYAPAKAGPKSSLVLAHGAGADQSHAWMVALAGALAARGVAVTTFNFPYMEARRRAPDPPDALQACFRDVVAHVRSEVGPEARVCVGGKSLGG